MKLLPLLNLSLDPLRLAIRNWWLGIIEHHYLISAEVEDNKAREHQKNAAHFQKKAAFIRIQRRSP